MSVSTAVESGFWETAMNALEYVGIALVVIMVVLIIYWWVDKSARWRCLQASYVTMGLYFGTRALDSYQRHSGGWVLWIGALAAVLLVTGGIWNLWRGKPPGPRPAPEDPPAEGNSED
jgi:uncharacterized membrane protein YjgN (DUF898 family)